MRAKAAQQDFQHLLSGEPIQLEVVVRAFHEHSRAFVEELEYGNSLVEDAGTYLGGSWTLRKFIRGEISDDVVRDEIESNRRLLNRMCTLFPEVVRQLRINSTARAMIAFGIVYDACSDYKSILASGRQEANRKKLIQKMARLQKQVAELSFQLEDSDATQQWGFESAQHLFMKQVHGKEDEARPFWKLQRDVRFLSWYLELEVHRARTKPSSFRVPDNQAKTHLVDTVYGLVLSEGHPSFVTTPGSKFAYLCSLLFEIATGKSDESLAGAINRYARSNERAEADQHEIDYGEERIRARDEDNFYDIKNNLKSGPDERIAELLTEMRDRALSSEARLLVMCELEDITKAAVDRDKIHGPFIMWADQMKTDWGEKMRELDASALEELRRDIETGKQRRSELRLT